MTAETLVKKASKGFPSSPQQAMATPVTMENTTKPKMLVLLPQELLIGQVVLSVT